eukprot:jgi/Botrbrau1/14092/Bobra.182_3s0038.1
MGGAWLKRSSKPGAHKNVELRAWMGWGFFPGQATPSRADLDVSGVVVQPAYRSTPWAAEAVQGRESKGAAARKALIMLVSESNICRSVFAEAMMRTLLEESGLSDLVAVESKGTRDYAVGEQPPQRVRQVAEEMGLLLPREAGARLLDPDRDIVRADLMLVMDKFTAADVLREVSVYDTINPEGNYCRKVRFLGSFHPLLAVREGPDAFDIDDPLYGNIGGTAELVEMQACAEILQEACRGLALFLQEIAAALPQGEGPAEFRSSLKAKIASMDTTTWLVPPMLQPR